MKLQVYTHMRLSYFLPLLAILFFLLIKDVTVESYGSHAYFITSVALIFYSCFVFPRLRSARKTIDQLTSAVRKESSALFRIVAKSVDLEAAAQDEFRVILNKYVMTKAGDYRPDSAQSEYQDLINFANGYKKDPVGQEIIDMLYQNEDNRSMVSMYLRSRVYSHEWLLSSVLLAITISGLVALGSVSTGIEQVGIAFLATAVTFPLIMLKKFSNSTHKHAQQVWGPFSRLIETGYRELG